MKDFIFISVTIILIVLLSLSILHNIRSPKIDIPEEYKLITKDTPIQGYYKNNTLVIEFKH